MGLKCPESIEELEELDKLIPFCRKELFSQAKSRIESGAACSISEAARQIGEETGRNPGSIRQRIIEEGKDRTVHPVQLSELSGTDKHIPKTSYQKEIIKEHEQEKKVVREEKKTAQKEFRKTVIAELPQDKHSVIYADPPWRYEFSETTSREIENQYPTMTLEEIKGLPVSNICAGDSVLLLWATSPKLTEALDVLGSWGFNYVTCAVWDKQKIGMGYYFRQQHEILLIGKKGNLPVPDPSSRVSSIISSLREQHSKKPDIVYQIIEQMYPNEKKIELFGRQTREGWSFFGNEKRF